MNTEYKMENKMYHIREDYKIREENDFLDTSGRSDEYQNDVYLLAKDITQKNIITSIADVGCGSGFKLLKYFKEYILFGYDLKPTVEILKIKYPNNNWIISNFNSKPESSDMVICADVIEHVDDPDELLEFIKKMNPEHIIISTPDRNILNEKLNRSHTGPPGNKHHIREWSFEEFESYISDHFNIISHSKIEHEYGQMIYCTPKN